MVDPWWFWIMASVCGAGILVAIAAIIFEPRLPDWPLVAIGAALMVGGGIGMMMVGVMSA